MANKVWLLKCLYLLLKRFWHRKEKEAQESGPVNEMKQ